MIINPLTCKSPTALRKALEAAQQPEEFSTHWLKQTVVSLWVQFLWVLFLSAVSSLDNLPKQIPSPRLAYLSVADEGMYMVSSGFSRLRFCFLDLKHWKWQH